MPISKFNPPFTNKDIVDFFDYKCENQPKAVFLGQWIEDTFPDLQIKLAYHVPFFWLGHRKVMYLHYVKLEDKLELELSFVHGNRMHDQYGMFQSKNIHTKAVMIHDITPQFLIRLENYIRQAVSLS